LGLQIVVRAIVAGFRTAEYRWPGAIFPPPVVENKNESVISPAHENHRFLWNFAWDFIGWHPEARQRDWDQTLFLGYMEMVAYPILIAKGHGEAVAGWIGLKTVPHWQQWLSHRESYV